MPSCGVAPMAGRPRSGAVARPILSRRLHAAEQAARHCVPEQARSLRPADESGGRGDARHRRQSQAPRRQDFNAHAGLADKKTFKRFIAPLRRIKWVVYCKAPFAGPKQVLRYLSRYTHRVAISNCRLIAADDAGVAFRWKDYRIDGPGRWKTMRLHPHEFIRRFLLLVLPRGFHRIRHYGLFANANRAHNIATARAFLDVAPPAADPQQQSDIAPEAPRVLPCPCPRCGARMIVIEVLASGCEPRWRPTSSRTDTS